MNCKNCNDELSENAKFCPSCGEEVSDNPITPKYLLSDLITNAIGWESKFFITVKNLVLQPQTVFTDYLGGVRKRYANPFAFFAITAAISFLCFNPIQGKLDDLRETTRIERTKELQVQIAEAEGEKKERLEKLLTNTNDFDQEFSEFTANNYTLISFLLLPLYGLLTFLVYGKPYSFSEHLILNAYVQGITFLLVSILALLSLLFPFDPLQLMLLPSVLYYMYAFSKLYDHGIGTALLKLLKFGLIVGVISFLPYGLGYLYGVVVS